MNKYIKLLLAVCIGLALGYGVNAARPFRVWNVPQDQNSNPLNHPGFEGKTWANFASTTEAVICTGNCLIYDVIQASGADGAYAILYDSAAATSGTTTILSRFEFDGTGHGSLSQGGSIGLPFVTTRGLGVDLSSVAGNEELLILYKDLD